MFCKIPFRCVTLQHIQGNGLIVSNKLWFPRWRGTEIRKFDIRQVNKDKERLRS